MCGAIDCAKCLVEGSAVSGVCIALGSLCQCQPPVVLDLTELLLEGAAGLPVALFRRLVSWV